jgi:nicotinate-nucleotide adenylyltransferase
MGWTIGIFGGSFDPPHVGHAHAARCALAVRVDELWLVPVFVHPRGKALAPYEHRVAMCERLATEIGPRVRVSRIEQTLVARFGRAVQTADVVRALAGARERSSRVQLRIVLGSDVAAHAPSWPRWRTLASVAPPLVIARAPTDLSSTAIRAQIAHAAPASVTARLVPAGVWDYITAHALYGWHPDCNAPVQEASHGTRLEEDVLAQAEAHRR